MHTHREGPCYRVAFPFICFEMCLYRWVDRFSSPFFHRQVEFTLDIFKLRTAIHNSPYENAGKFCFNVVFNILIMCLRSVLLKIYHMSVRSYETIAKIWFNSNHLTFACFHYLCLPFYPSPTLTAPFHNQFSIYEAIKTENENNTHIWRAMKKNSFATARLCRCKRASNILVQNKGTTALHTLYRWLR